MNQIIILEDTDDITAIRSRINFLLPALTQQSIQVTNKVPKRTRLLIIIPGKNRALDNLVNMKLLARTIHARAIELAIISSNPVVRDNARAAGVKAFGSRRSARWAGWTTSQAAVITADATLPPAVAADETTSRKRVTKKQYTVMAGSSRPGPIKYIFQQFGALLLVVMLAILLVLGVVLLMPQATVTITPVAQPVAADLIVKADPNETSVNFQELSFPARIQQVDISLSDYIETVETELAPVEKASGQVIFINRTEEPQLIPISTTVATSAGEPIEFVTVNSTTIPAGVGTTTPSLVVAVEGGPKGNVAAGQINRFLDPTYGLLARVINEQALSGGVFAPAKIVVEADKERLTAYLHQRIQQVGLEQLQKSLTEQEFIPPESVQVIVLDMDFAEFSGDFSDTFSGEMQAVVRATVIGGYNANRLALAALDTQVPAGFELDIEGLNFGAGEIVDFHEGITSFRIEANGQAVPVIDGWAIAKEIAWLPIGEAQELISQQYPLATVPGVDLEPEWLVTTLGRLPFSALRIKVIINDAVTLMADGSQ